MRSVLWKFVAAIAVTVFLSCGGTGVFAQAAAAPELPAMPDIAPRDEGPIRVVTTTPLLADLVNQIGGSRVEATSLLPANADPHDFEPAPQDVVALESAELVVEHGLGLDRWARELVAASGTDAPIVTATDGVQTLETDEEGFADGDPHVWFDPSNVKVMTANIATALSEIDPDGAGGYAARQEAYDAQLDALDVWIAEQIASIPAERRKLVTNHDAFGYFVDRYGLQFVGAVIPSLDSRAEPSAKETADLLEKIEAEGVPAIFTESSVNPELERELADQAGVEVVPNLYADTLGEPGSGAATFIEMMIYDTNLIVQALR